jgi:hypothetical protein
MNKRIAKLPANQLIATIRQSMTELAALKQGQRISGQSGVLSYAAQTDETWDVTGTIGTPSDTAWHSTTVTVTWTGDGSQDIAFANVSFDVFVNGTDSAHQLTPQSHTWTGGSEEAEISYLGQSEASHHTYAVQFGLLTYQEISYYIKGYGVGSSPGTITVSAVLES